MGLNIQTVLYMIVTAALLGLGLFVWTLFKSYKASAVQKEDPNFKANYVNAMASRPVGGANSPLTWESFSKGQDLMNGKGKHNPELVRHFFEIPVVLTGEYIPGDSYGPEYDHEFHPDSGFSYDQPKGPGSQRDFAHRPAGANAFKPRRPQ